MYARRRDIVQSGNASLQQIVEQVTGYRMDKDMAIRCSKWSRTNLSEEQLRYAAIDVIKPLEAYFAMELMPDLCQRLDPALAVSGR
jgi:ribonuclease D